MIWPGENLRGTTRGARKSISLSARPEKSWTFESICFCVSARGMADILTLCDKSHRQAERIFLHSRGSGGRRAAMEDPMNVDTAKTVREVALNNQAAIRVF